MYLKEIDLVVGWICLADARDNWRIIVNTVMNIRVSENAGNFLTSFTRRTFLHGVSYIVCACRGLECHTSFRMGME